MVGALLLIHLLSITGAKADEGKPFGTGVGPVFIGGRDTDNEGTQVALRIFRQYINYKVLSDEATTVDLHHYQTYITGDNLCIGTCPYHSSCEKGICVCNQGYQQVFGQCRTNTSVAHFDQDDDAKYRKPTPPPLPEFCYCEERDPDTGDRRRVICREAKSDSWSQICKKTTFPNVFDDKLQFCRPGDHNFCKGKDINMFCTDNKMYDPSPEFNTKRRVCGCRKEMKFDSQRMECRIHIGADCSGVVKTGYTNPNHLTELLKGEEPATAEVVSILWGKKNEVLQGFCLLLDDQVDMYKGHLVGAAGGEVFNSWSEMLMAMATKAWMAIVAWFV